MASILKFKYVYQKKVWFSCEIAKIRLIIWCGCFVSNYNEQLLHILVMQRLSRTYAAFEHSQIHNVYKIVEWHSFCWTSECIWILWNDKSLPAANWNIHMKWSEIEIQIVMNNRNQRYMVFANVTLHFWNYVTIAVCWLWLRE